MLGDEGLGTRLGAVFMVGIVSGFGTVVRRWFMSSVSSFGEALGIFFQEMSFVPQVREF